jgi:hypothetical protein
VNDLRKAAKLYSLNALPGKFARECIAQSSLPVFTAFEVPQEVFAPCKRNLANDIVPAKTVVIVTVFTLY